MKRSALLMFAALIATPASAEVLLGAGCSGAQTFISTSDPARKGPRIVILSGGCAAEGPRREVIHTMSPGEPMRTTILIRNQGGAAAGGPAVIDVARAIETGTTGQTRIVRVR
jgi:hypothetical protein